MPNAEEYEEIFTAKAEPFFAGPFSNKRQISHAYSQAKHAIYLEKVKQTKEITRTWQEGFSKIKAENDQMHRDLEIGYKQAIMEANASAMDEEEGIEK